MAPPKPRFAGRGSGKLEIFKFALYVSIPVIASVAYGTPENMQAIVNQFRFVEYPPAEKDDDILISQPVHPRKP